MRTFDQILQSTSGILFPADLEPRRVEMDTRNIEGDTPLHVLIWQKDVSGAEELIEAGADPNAIGDMEETPLHIAVRQDLVDLVDSLLRAGADPDVRSAFGDTPRTMAAKKKGAIARVLKQAAPNNSFKPRPLRGSA